MKKTCIQCGRDFEITEGEANFYKEKGYELPKRCKECRNQNKMNRRKDRSNVNNHEVQSKPQRNKSDTNKPEINKSEINKSERNKPEINKSEINKSERNKSDLENRQSPVEVKFSGGIGKYIAAVVVVFVLCFGYTIWGGTDTEKDGTDISSNVADTIQDNNDSTYSFRNEKYLSEHFEKHGKDFDYETKEEYEAGANRVINAKDVLHKIEAEDGDDVYYVEDSNEFVIVSTDGYIRTYFKPSDGIDYYNRQ